MAPPNSPPASLDAIKPARVHWPAYANAVLWGLGAGFATTTLAVYLMNGLGRPRVLTASLLLAAPQFVGLARVLAIRFSADRPFRKRFCIGAYGASGLILAGLPCVVWRFDEVAQYWNSNLNLQQMLGARERMIGGREATIAIIIGLWCAYHLFEYLGTVALWAWLRDLVPLEHRGVFIGRRELWIDSGRVLGMLGCAAMTGLGDPRRMEVSVYARMAAIGAALFVLAAIPLAFLPGRRPDTGRAEPLAARPRARFTDALALIVDPRLSRLLIYGCWFSFFNGATQGAQNLFVWNVLGVPLAWMLGLRLGMTTGQAAISPWLGKLSDRIGYRPVLFVCQAIVALSMFGYLVATEEMSWVIGFTWIGWIAYAGINIALPGLLLKLSPPHKAGGTVAGFFAITGLCYGLSTVIGGFIFDNVRGQEFQVMGMMLDRYQYSFYVAIVTRILGCFFIFAIDEPPSARAELTTA